MLCVENHFYHSESTFEVGSLCNSIVHQIWHLVINMLSVVTFLPYYFPYNHSNISKVIDNEYHGGLSDDFFTILFPSHPFLSNISKVASNSPAWSSIFRISSSLSSPAWLSLFRKIFVWHLSNICLIFSNICPRGQAILLPDNCHYIKDVTY